MRSACASAAAGDDTADRQVAERGDGVGLGPQTHAARGEPPVAVVEQQDAVEPGLDAVADGDDAELMPLAERRRLHAAARELAPAPVVGVEAEVTLEGV